MVHRLDKQVSGVILFAKTPEFHRYLNLQFEHRQVLKTYLAVVHGQLSQDGRIETPLRRFGSGRMAADPETGKACLTEYDVLDRRPETTLLRVRPLTGRKHQIRAHLFGIGHPIVGDPLYGDKLFQRSFPRLMLHALGIEFRLPDGRPVEIRTAAPSGFEPSYCTRDRLIYRCVKDFLPCPIKTVNPSGDRRQSFHQRPRRQADGALSALRTFYKAGGAFIAFSARGGSGMATVIDLNVMTKIRRLPTLPGVAIKLLQAIRSENPSIKEISEIISADPP